ncbi:PucR family transcriptional regulator [Clostridium sp. DL1XJH146]
MFLSCRELLKYEKLKAMKVVAGENGLDRLIRWVHIVDIPEGSEWVGEGVLLFITGISIKDDNEAFLKLIQDINNKNLAGIVVNVGPYIKKIPNEVVDLGNKLHFPIFEVPFDVRLVQLTEYISKTIIKRQLESKSKEEFLRELIFQDYREEMDKRAEFHGFSLKKKYFTAIIDIDGFSEFIKMKNINKEDEIIQFKYIINRIIKNNIEGKLLKYMILNQSDDFYLIIQIDDKNDDEDKRNLNIKEEEIKVILSNIQNDIMKRIEGMTVSIGISGVSYGIKDIKTNFINSENVLQILKMCKKIDCIRSYKDLGIYRLFFNVENKQELKALYYEYLKELLIYDEVNEQNLMETLEVYLYEGGNITQTAAKLYLHRNTLNYRLAKIEEILNLDIKETSNRFNILMAIKIKKFLEEK